MDTETIVEELARELELTAEQKDRAREILRRINREGSQTSRAAKTKLIKELRKLKE